MQERSKHESVCDSTTVASLPAACVDESEQSLSTSPVDEQLWQHRDSVGWGELRCSLHRRGPTHSGLPAWRPALQIVLMLTYVSSYPKLKSRKLHRCKLTWR